MKMVINKFKSLMKLALYIKINPSYFFNGSFIKHMINNKNVRLRSCILIKLTMFSTESWVRLYKVSPVK